MVKNHFASYSLQRFFIFQIWPFIYSLFWSYSNHTYSSSSSITICIFLYLYTFHPSACTPTNPPPKSQLWLLPLGSCPCPFEPTIVRKCSAGGVRREGHLHRQASFPFYCLGWIFFPFFPALVSLIHPLPSLFSLQPTAAEGGSESA